MDLLRVGLPDRLGQLPAILALDRAEQPAQVAGAPLSDLSPIEEGEEAGIILAVLVSANSRD